MIKDFIKTFYGADDAGASGGVAYIKIKNPIDGIEYDVPKTLEVLIGGIAAWNRKQGADKKQAEIDALKVNIEDLTLEVTEAKKKGGNVPKEIEALTEQHKKSITALTEEKENALKVAEGFKSKFENTKIDNELYSALPVSKLHNPNETKETLRRMGAARLEERIDPLTGKGTGEFNTVLTLNVKDASGNVKQQTLSPTDAVKAFSQMEEYKFHFNNTLSPGGGGRDSGNGQGAPLPGDLNAQLADAVKRKDLAAQVAIEEQIFEKQTGTKL
jgi:hypothetical protein